MTKIQGARNGSQKDNEFISKRVSSFTKDERWVNGETNCIRSEFKSQDSKHIQAKNLGKTEHKE